MGLSRGKNEDDVGGRFFKSFQEGIERCRRQHMDFVDDVDLASTIRRHILRVFANLTHSFNAIIGGAIDLVDIHTRAGSNFLAARALVAAVQPLHPRGGLQSGRRVFAANDFGKNPSDRSFANPA